MEHTTYPVIMGILNATPDSFSDGSTNYDDLDFQISKAFKMIDDGADIIDIGGESTRPGAEYISAEEESRRIIPIVKTLRQKSEITISIDTNKAAVAEKALQAGADIINDITGLTGDPEMGPTIAAHSAQVVLMHMQGTPKDMQDAPNYTDTVDEVMTFLNRQTARAIADGVSEENIILDPGFGFGKRLEDNCLLMQNISEFVATGYRVLIGVSRKSMITQALNVPVDQRTTPSVALAVMAYLQGARIFRVHDVRETRVALDMIHRVNLTPDS